LRLLPLLRQQAGRLRRERGSDEPERAAAPRNSRAYAHVGRKTTTPFHHAPFLEHFRCHSRNAALCIRTPATAGVKQPVNSPVVVRALVNRRGIDRCIVTAGGDVCDIPTRIVNLLVDPSSFDWCLVRGGEGHCTRMPPNPTTRRKAATQRPFYEWQVDATAFLYEVVRAADALREAKAFGGGPALHYGARWQVLRAIERCGGAPTFSEIARSLRVTRQTAREHAIKAARVGIVELLPAPDDRRVVQVALTPAGRKELEAQRMLPLSWVAAVLNGLKPEAMRSTHHVLRVLRLRLERDARERRRAAPRAG
jgi:DNA-binding MarR family transcriptional regulator